MTRREWSNLVCRRVSEKISEIAPRGLGHWDEAWELVEAPSQVLLDTLADFERTGALVDKEAAVAAAEAVVHAWSEAARLWEEAGRPTPETRELAGHA